MKVIRFGVSMENDLLETLDQYVKDNRFSNRSQGIRYLITKVKMEKKLDFDGIVGGSITLSYNHHQRELLDTITEIQHDFHSVILCSQHVHLDHHVCLEIIALKGKASELEELSNRLTAVKGIIHSDLSLTMLR